MKSISLVNDHLKIPDKVPTMTNNYLNLDLNKTLESLNTNITSKVYAMDKDVLFYVGSNVMILVFLAIFFYVLYRVSKDNMHYNDMLKLDSEMKMIKPYNYFSAR